jgi:hypothetical protein
MSTGDELRRIACEAAQYAQARVTQLDAEIFDLQKQLASKQTERDAASSALDRYANFPLSAGADGPCPYCWIETGQNVPIRPIGGGTSTEDFFRCSNGHDITVPF